MGDVSCEKSAHDQRDWPIFGLRRMEPANNVTTAGLVSLRILHVEEVDKLADVAESDTVPVSTPRAIEDHVRGKSVDLVGIAQLRIRIDIDDFQLMSRQQNLRECLRFHFHT